MEVAKMSVSEDNWSPARLDPASAQLEWITVPGTDVALQVMAGWPVAVMGAVAADFNAYIEPLRDPDSASYTPTNSVATSNHLNGTAMDLNWNSHRFQTRGTFTAGQMAVIRELLDFYEGTIFWAGDWDDPIDEMHWQMGYSTYNNPATGNFISRKIRADGFSTMRRQPAPPPLPPPPPSSSAAAVLAAATGIPLARAVAILPAVQAGLIGSHCTTINRIAMWLAQEGEESAAFTATVEIGNLDGSTYQGRTWEQITGLANYAAFSQWAFNNHVPGVTSPTYFVDNPAALGDPQYESLGATWYWTVARPQINSLCDRGDVAGVTQAINGGQNGIVERTRRWNLALAQGDALLTLINSGGFLMSLSDTQQQQIYNALCGPVASQSPFRADESPAWTMPQLGVNDDGFLHPIYVEWAAGHGQKWAVDMLNTIAALNDSGRTADVALAKNILDKLPTTARGFVPITSEALPQLPANAAAVVNNVTLMEPPDGGKQSVKFVDGAAVVVATKPGSVTRRDQLKAYWHLAIVLTGLMAMGLNQLTPDDLTPTTKIAVNLGISFLTALGVWLKSNEHWANTDNNATTTNGITP